ncbi:hypothetical protein F2Q68_00024619 [Brassica cretica]|uniref:Protein kinase domain-containing protein n=1 Tax=Brassica cretica TaxID=69181 RepID=A0A8S9I7D8_BRACR|nr:hypothetical protein F2Q68_00024619 [Brassica cretica]
MCPGLVQAMETEYWCFYNCLRDLKAENLLLISDGQWKLCDFGSVSTNHKVFERAEEMGIEEDNIRKHTTPGYRAPEMWDLFRREVISEKVDIWALGCLLFRICYFKNAFDGESKLQILNGNYRIPESPKYSSSVTDLIKDMLQGAPDERPDITQIWFRVNELLPANLQKSLPDQPPEMGSSKPASKSSPAPRRSPPPPPPSSGEPASSGGPLGAFWATQHAKTSVVSEDNKGMPIFDEPNSHNSHPQPNKPSPAATNNRSRVSKDDAFNSFVADFDTVMVINLRRKRRWRLRSQRQELQDLKQTLASKTVSSSPSRDSPGMLCSASSTPSRDKVEGTVWDLQQDRSDWSTGSSDPNSWQPFSDASKGNINQSVRTKSKPASASQGFEPWGFETESFRAAASQSSASATTTAQRSMIDYPLFLCCKLYRAVENLLLISDGQWKLCDFGSVSTNHKVFERAEEMGIEEDNIRKHTTPGYRAPEMWDLFRREVISEKVDIWALGCLLFRICYFKNAFDGESKLQILNGNYRIPESPKYSSSVTDLIKDMLQGSPAERPDITQIWFRVNELLPVNLQNSLPDQPPEMGSSKPASKSSPAPRRSPPPPPPSSGEPASSGGPLGAFWATQHAKTSVVSEGNKGMPIFDEPNSHNSHHSHKTSPAATTNRSRVSKDDAFNSFVADFDTTKLDNGNKPAKEEALVAEVERLKEELKRTKSEKAEITAKFEKLSAICRSQRQELQDLKQTIASKTVSSSPSRDSPGMRSTSSTPSRDKVEGTVWDLQQDRSDWSTGSSDPNSWQPFGDASKGNNNQSVRTKSKPASASQGFEPWGFETESFRAAASQSSASATTTAQRFVSSGSSSQRLGNTKMRENQKAAQPAGWAGF